MKNFTVKRQNVSLGIKVGNVAIDFVPGRHQGGTDEDHTLYVRRGDTWKKTNVQSTSSPCSGPDAPLRSRR